MYAPLKLDVQPSAVLKQIHLAVHVALLIACLHSIYVTGLVALMVLIPIFGVIAWYIKKIIQHEFLFLKPRQWLFDESCAQLFIDDIAQSVSIETTQVLPWMILIQYRYVDANLRWWQVKSHWDVLVPDACEREAFRQTRATLKTLYQSRISSSK